MTRRTDGVRHDERFRNRIAVATLIANTLVGTAAVLVSLYK